MHVRINTAALDDVEVPISDTAAKRANLSFNPSKNERVDRLKSIAAAFMSECENLFDGTPEVCRSTSTAMTQMEAAAMFAVKAATSN